MIGLSELVIYICKGGGLLSYEILYLDFIELITVINCITNKVIHRISTVVCEFQSNLFLILI